MAASVAWLHEWAGQLAELSDNVLTKVPDTDDWEIIRHFLSNTSNMLRRGDVRAGARALFKILPYVQRALSSVEKSTNLSSTYEITETISQHFLVDEEAREELQDFMKQIKIKMDMMRTKVGAFAEQLDLLLEEVILEGRDISMYLTLKMAFQMNRISALIKTCEQHLKQARQMIDALDTHIASKNLLATMLSYVTFIGGLVFSASGNFPVSAACFTAATASRKSAQNLEDYRKQLSQIDKEHRQCQADLSEWRHRFRGEQTNFLLLIGLKQAIIVIALLAVAFFFLGKAANFLVFAMIFLYLVVKSEETNQLKYYAGLGLGVAAMFVEYEKHYGMAIFNLLSCIMIGLNQLGFVEL